MHYGKFTEAAKDTLTQSAVSVPCERWKRRLDADNPKRGKGFP